MKDEAIVVKTQPVSHLRTVFQQSAKKFFNLIKRIGPEHAKTRIAQVALGEHEKLGSFKNNPGSKTTITVELQKRK